MNTTVGPVAENKAFQLKGSLFTLSIMQLINPDAASFSQQLEEIVQQAPKFFQHAPMVIDLQSLEKDGIRINFKQLVDAMRQHHLIPIGICNGSPDHQQSAVKAGLALFPGSKQQDIDIGDSKPSKTSQSQAELNLSSGTTNTAKATEKTTATEPTTTSLTQTAKIITQPVRSGQQVYAKGGDLIVLAPVSHGAELLADGNIHVYDVLRGRALAGISGNQSARIFCRELAAELVSIAGLYQLKDELPENSSADFMQVYVDNGKLAIKAV